ncbi:hypothetical protein AB0G02_16660, partial [Actinosynnema sp. NPDC023658]|uniref:hypothetical protein n=1 Tax=Actinosynnema sp. NPDC023658 TaxID=3155465 RepID=UPI003405EECD
ALAAVARLIDGGFPDAAITLSEYTLDLLEATRHLRGFGHAEAVTLDGRTLCLPSMSSVQVRRHGGTR